IIFMVMIPKKVPEMSVRVPPESTKKIQKPPQNETLVIGLTKDGAVTLNRQPIDKTALPNKLEKLLEYRDKKVIFVNFDDDVTYNAAVEILDTAKRSGAEVLGIMKDKEKKTPDNLRL
ncbi:MAG: biopolymer transporter ExbD, partial [Myxococcales bacterium]|nr:biopolymer transporter ExbD [Myxococcales bacterium]